MGKAKLITYAVLMIGAMALGFYFRSELMDLVSGFSSQIEKFRKSDFANFVAQTGREFVTPPPLLTIGKNQSIVLLKTKIMDETNLQRQQNGLPELRENAKLDEAAAAKANDMFKKQYFEHISPTGVDPGKLVQNHGYNFIVAGENLILGNFSSEEEVVQKWMNSPGHRANILNKRYTEIGVAIIKGTYENEIVWIGVQEFGLPSSACNEPDGSIKTTVETYKEELNSMAQQIELSRSQISSVSSRSERYRDLVNAYNQLVRQYNTLADQTKQLISKYNSQVTSFNSCVAGK